MQVMKRCSGSHRVLFGKRCRTALAVALSMALAACQASNSGEATLAGSVAPSSAVAATPAEAPQPAPQAVTTADAAIDDDLAPRRPDDSYRKANLRPAYDACVNASDGVTPALQDCGDEEFAYQQGRLRAAFAKIVAAPDGKAKDAVMDAQAAYMDDTDRYCSWNPDEDGQGQMLDAQSCRLNRTANRADALQSAGSSK